MKKILRNKKGSHVGVILSFVIFVIFLVFLFDALQPALKIEEDKDATLNSLKDKLIETSSDMLTIKNVNYSVSSTPPVVDCINVDNSLTGNAIVKKPTGEIASYSASGEIITIKNLALTNNFFNIYISDSIVDYSFLGSCSQISNDYQVNFVEEKKLVFVSKFQEVIERDYESLKQTFNIGNEADFSYSLLNSNKEVVLEQPYDEFSLNVYVNDFPILYADADANIVPGYIRVRLW